MEQYAASAGELIRHTPRDIIFHRVTAYAKPPVLLAPQWCSSRWKGLNAVVQELARAGGQGSALSR